MLTVALVLAWTGAAWAEEAADRCLGMWYTGKSKDTKIQIYKGEDGKINGKIVWFKDPNYGEGDAEAGKPLRDRENPDESKRNRPLLGLNMIQGFTLDEKGMWSGGTIYDPEEGKTYKCVMKLADDDNNTLNVRGYIGVPAFGRTVTWLRVTEKDLEREKKEAEEG
jgi:uncharacterized protein (DUF2147 family)